MSVTNNKMITSEVCVSLLSRSRINMVNKDVMEIWSNRVRIDSVDTKKSEAID